MKPFSILLIRLLAIYLVINPLLSMSSLLLGPVFDAKLTQWLPVIGAVIGTPIIAGVVLWFSAGALANKIHGSAGAGVELSIGEKGLVRSGCFLIGVYLFVQHIGTALSQWAWSGRVAYGSLAVIVLSIGLMLGTRFLGKLYRRLKYYE